MIQTDALPITKHKAVISGRIPVIEQIATDQKSTFADKGLLWSVHMTTTLPIHNTY